MGKALSLLLLVIVIATTTLFVGRWWWFPEDISTHGPLIDAQFMRTLFVVGVGFIGAQLALGYAIFRYGRRGNERAVYSHGSSKLEATWTLITAGVFVAIAILGQRVWAQLHLNEAPPDAVKISVVAQQFQFNFHYPGADSTFGRTEYRFVDDSNLNYVGLDPDDPAGKDDVQVTTLIIPVNRPVELSLRSKDVIHNFFVPALRFKQDTVPGLNIKVHFQATKEGKYEIPCAELCGQGHSRMKGYMLVVPESEYQALAAMPEAGFKARMGEILKTYQ